MLADLAQLLENSMNMEHPFNELRRRYLTTRRSLKRDEQRQQRIALRKEEEELDEQYENDIDKRNAVNERRITLALASSVSILLDQHGITPSKEWMYEVPIFSKWSWLFEEPKQTGSLKQIALEGWPLELDLDTSDDSFQSSPFQLVLTPDEGVNLHSPLMWYKEVPAPSNSAEHFEPITKEDVHPLSKVPLSPEDMPWSNPNYRVGRFGNYSSHVHGFPGNFFVNAQPDPEETARLQERFEANKAAGNVGTPFDTELFIELHIRERQKADYDLYRKLRIEKKIRNALADVAARYEIFDIN